jgi:hypothetical protein
MDNDDLFMAALVFFIVLAMYIFEPNLVKGGWLP